MFSSSCIVVELWPVSRNVEWAIKMRSRGNTGDRTLGLGRWINSNRQKVENIGAAASRDAQVSLLMAQDNLESPLHVHVSCSLLKFGIAPGEQLRIATLDSNVQRTVVKPK